MSLREDSLAEKVLESPISRTQRTLRSLIGLQALNPLYLFLPLNFFLLFLSRAALFSQRFRVYLALRLNGLHNRIEFHLFVVLKGPIDAINGKKLIACVTISTRIESTLAVIQTFPLVFDHIKEIMVILRRILSLFVTEMLLKVVP